MQLDSVVQQLGGVSTVFDRFFAMFEVRRSPCACGCSNDTTQYSNRVGIPALEWRRNDTRALLRVLRDRGVLGRLPSENKQALARHWTSRRMYGGGVRFVLQQYGLRQRLHDMAAEALVCLLESCAREEAAAVVEVCGGEDVLHGRLVGRLGLGRRYATRWQVRVGGGLTASVETTHRLPRSGLPRRALNNT